MIMALKEDKRTGVATGLSEKFLNNPVHYVLLKCKRITLSCCAGLLLPQLCHWSGSPYHASLPVQGMNHHGDWIAVNCGSMPGDPTGAETGIVVQAEDFRPGTPGTVILFTSLLVAQ